MWTEHTRPLVPDKRANRRSVRLLREYFEGARD